MKWISQLLDRVTGPTELGPPCIMRLTQNDVRMELYEYQLPCGHDGYLVSVEYRLGDDHWIPIASLRDFNLSAAIELLQQAQLCIARLQQ
jgi:hypothetical protein